MLMELISGFFQLLVLLGMVLLSVAFFTLFERKILGFIQVRKGPSKVGMWGILQPFSDAIKLFSKEDSSPIHGLSLFYWMFPFFMFFLSLLFWLTIPYKMNLLELNVGMLIMMVMFSFSVYGVMMSGWSSNSKYSLIGSLRSVIQTLSYEILLSFFLMIIIFVGGSMSLYVLDELGSLLVFPLSFLGLLGMIIFVMEMSRSPFDLTEGESELVSGFNVEYGGMMFSVIFLGENLMVVFSSYMFIGIFGGGFNGIFSIVLPVFLMGVLIWIRGCFPRIRVDFMMNMCWLMVLPLLFIVFFMIVF